MKRAIFAGCNKSSCDFNDEIEDVSNNCNGMAEGGRRNGREEKGI